jgi:hypothetical protein
LDTEQVKRIHAGTSNFSLKIDTAITCFHNKSILSVDKVRLKVLHKRGTTKMKNVFFNVMHFYIWNGLQSGG